MKSNETASRNLIVLKRKITARLWEHKEVQYTSVIHTQACKCMCESHEYVYPGRGALWHLYCIFFCLNNHKTWRKMCVRSSWSSPSGVHLGGWVGGYPHCGERVHCVPFAALHLCCILLHLRCICAAFVLHFFAFALHLCCITITLLLQLHLIPREYFLLRHSRLH